MMREAFFSVEHNLQFIIAEGCGLREDEVASLLVDDNDREAYLRH